MKLHEDKKSLEDMIGVISQNTGIRADILEKDYYVTLLLYELAGKQSSLPAFFKGGTALYKALGTIRRFSEDIDLTVKTDDCSNTQAKRRLERAAGNFTSLPRTENKGIEHNRKGSISCAYDYIPSVLFNSDDPLQRFGHVRVEATSFTVSEPTNPLEIAPVIYEMASPEQRDILSKTFDVSLFTIETIRIERIFVDKIFAAEFYYNDDRHMYFDVAKHIYDIAIMTDLDLVQTMMDDKNSLARMVEYKRKEESFRIGSDLADKPFSEFSIIKSIASNNEMRNIFNRMQDVYVFDDAYKIEFLYACDILNNVFEDLVGLD
jgi:hypothetical protein